MYINNVTNNKTNNLNNGAKIILLRADIIIIVIVIIIEEKGITQEHGAVGGLQSQIQILQHQRQRNLQKVTGEKRKMKKYKRKYKTMGERKSKVSEEL